jgi:hypothetical protein
MANLIYRTSSNPAVPGVTSVKGTALTNLEIDGNFKSVDAAVVAATATANAASTTDNVLAMAIALG